MKKRLKAVVLWAFVLMAPGLLPRTSAQAVEVQQLLLNVEKLAQLKQILADMKNGYTIISRGYNTIRQLSEGNFNLHEAFLDGLMQVSPAVSGYRRIADIIRDQLTLVKTYKKAFSRFKRSRWLSPEELSYISRVYDNLFGESLDNLDQLLMVVTSGALSMNDNERLEAIDRIYAEMQEQLQFLRHFNNHTTLLAMQRAKAGNDVVALQRIYRTKESAGW